MIKSSLFVFLSIFIFSSPLFAQTGGAHRSLGSISFFLDETKPSAPGTSVHLREKDKAYFCVRFNQQDPRLKNTLRYLRRIEMTFETENPARKLVAKTEGWNQLISPDENGCYIGKIKIPKGAAPGKYQLSEFDLWLSSSSSLSLREELNQIKPRGVIQVGSPERDLQSPIIEKIKTKTDFERNIRFSNSRARGRIKFELFATDSISGIDPTTLHIFFKLFIDKNVVDILEANCKTLFPNYSYDCQLYFSRAEPHLRTRLVELELDSVSVADYLGNETVLNQPKQLKQLSEGNLLRYTFYSSKDQRRRWNVPKEDLDTYLLQKKMKKFDQKEMIKE